MFSRRSASFQRGRTAAERVHSAGVNLHDRIQLSMVLTGTAASHRSLRVSSAHRTRCHERGAHTQKSHTHTHTHTQTHTCCKYTVGTLLLTLGSWDGRHTSGVKCCSVLYRLRVFQLVVM